MTPLHNMRLTTRKVNGSTLNMEIVSVLILVSSLVVLQRTSML